MRVHLFGAVCALLLSASVASAGPILVPTSVSASSQDPNIATPIGAINQSGLSAAYVAGVTDFDSFVATTTAANLLLSELGGTGAPPSFLEFDFASVVSVDAIALWNQFGTAALDTFTVETSLVSDFSVSQTYGIFTTSPLGGARPAVGEVFTFAPTSLRYVRLNMLSNAGFPTAVRVNEVVFRSAPVPEPGTIALMGLGMVGLIAGARRRKRKSAAA